MEACWASIQQMYVPTEKPIWLSAKACNGKYTRQVCGGFLFKLALPPARLKICLYESASTWRHAPHVGPVLGLVLGQRVTHAGRADCRYLRARSGSLKRIGCTQTWSSPRSRHRRWHRRRRRHIAHWHTYLQYPLSNDWPAASTSTWYPVVHREPGDFADNSQDTLYQNGQTDTRAAPHSGRITPNPRWVRIQHRDYSLSLSQFI